jgi:hypothetical protein
MHVTAAKSDGQATEELDKCAARIRSIRAQIRNNDAPVGRKKRTNSSRGKAVAARLTWASRNVAYAESEVQRSPGLPTFVGNPELEQYERRQPCRGCADRSTSLDQRRRFTVSQSLRRSNRDDPAGPERVVSPRSARARVISAEETRLIGHRPTRDGSGRAAYNPRTPQQECGWAAAPELPFVRNIRA